MDDPERKPDEAERVRQLTNRELQDEWHQCEYASEVCELIVGEMERRNLDAGRLPENAYPVAGWQIYLRNESTKR